MNGMMNNMLNLNNMMINNQNNMNPNDKELILDLINQNIQMANQITMNNHMIKTKIENSFLGNMNQTNDSLEKLMNSIDFFPLRSGNKINVVFEHSAGYKIHIIAPLDITIKELLEAFYIKFQIYAKIHNIIIDNLRNYYFICKSGKINFDEQKTISEYGLVCFKEQIIFYMGNEIIGG